MYPVQRANITSPGILIEPNFDVPLPLSSSFPLSLLPSSLSLSLLTPLLDLVAVLPPAVLVVGTSWLELCCGSASLVAVELLACSDVVVSDSAVLDSAASDSVVRSDDVSSVAVIGVVPELDRLDRG